MGQNEEKIGKIINWPIANVFHLTNECFIRQFCHKVNLSTSVFQLLVVVEADCGRLVREIASGVAANDIDVRIEINNLDEFAIQNIIGIERI